MSNIKILELRTLDDEELLGVVGGGCHTPPSCQPAPRPCGGIDVDVDICVSIFV